MYGLAVLFALFIILALCSGVLFVVLKIAKRYKRNRFLWSGITVVILFLLLSWDWIPAKVYYWYSCKNLEPMQIYKTPEAWWEENKDSLTVDRTGWRIRSEMGIPETNDKGYHRGSVSSDNKTSAGFGNTLKVYQDVFFKDITYKKIPATLRVQKYEHQLIDMRTGKVLVKGSRIQSGDNKNILRNIFFSGSQYCNNNNFSAYIEKYRALEKPFINQGD